MLSKQLFHQLYHRQVQLFLQSLQPDPEELVWVHKQAAAQASRSFVQTAEILLVTQAVLQVCSSSWLPIRSRQYGL